MVPLNWTLHPLQRAFFFLASSILRYSDSFLTSVADGLLSEGWTASVVWSVSSSLIALSRRLSYVSQ